MFVLAGCVSGPKADELRADPVARIDAVDQAAAELEFQRVADEISLARALVERHGGEVPTELADLVAAGLTPRKSMQLVPGGGFGLQVAERVAS